MKIRLLIFLLLCTQAKAAEFRFAIRNAEALPVTFASVFPQGAVPPGTSLSAFDLSGAPLPSQIDVKARHKDGSLRHAVITVVLPRASKTQELVLRTGKPATPAMPPVPQSALPAAFDARLRLEEKTSALSISLRDLMAASKPAIWLSGPLVSEWWYTGALREASGKPNPHLTALFGIRSYGAGRPLRVEVVVENTRIYAPAPRSYGYSASITLGTHLVYTEDSLVQPSHTRWRKVFWWDRAPIARALPALALLKAARAIPNYRERDVPLEPMLRFYRKARRGPMGSGVIQPAMPVTGQRPDIGPLPGWAVAYLLTGDPQAEELTMSAGDLSGSFPSHYRNEKSGSPATSEEYPTISVHYNFVGRGKGNLPLPDLAGFAKPFSAEASHEPSLGYVPYLTTGERYYLEELQFWSQWNSWGTAPEYHGFGKGLIGWDQIRGQAWSLRTLAQAAYITPDNDPLKGPLLRQIKANAAWYDRAYTNNPAANPFHIALRASDSAQAVAPWMDDFLTWAAAYTVQLGFEEFRPFARWKSDFAVQRMIHRDFCPVLATKYYMQVMDKPHHFLADWSKLYITNLPKDLRASPPRCGSGEMARALKLSMPGEMMGDSRSPNGYPAQLQPALAAAVDLDTPGAKSAWENFNARPVKPSGGVDPRWDILPWTP